MQTATVKLSIVHGSEPKEMVFEEPTCCVVGRADDCEIQVPRDEAHMNISRHHCLLEIDPPQVRVRDLGSRNGTYVNGELIGQRFQRAKKTDLNQVQVYDLKSGDEIQVGNTVFRVSVDLPSPKESEQMPMFLPLM